MFAQTVGLFPSDIPVEDHLSSLLDVHDPGMLIIAVVVAVVIGVFIGVVSGMGGVGNIIGKLFGAVWFIIIAVNVFGSAASLASGFSFGPGFVGVTQLPVTVTDEQVLTPGCAPCGSTSAAEDRRPWNT